LRSLHVVHLLHKMTTEELSVQTVVFSDLPSTTFSATAMENCSINQLLETEELWLGTVYCSTNRFCVDLTSYLFERDL